LDQCPQQEQEPPEQLPQLLPEEEWLEEPPLICTPQVVRQRLVCMEWQRLHSIGASASFMLRRDSKLSPHFSHR
jgi:hypothetical protein